MTQTLKIVRLDDFIADVDSVDLLSGGYKLAENGYTPVVAPLGAASVHEVITLNIAGTSKDHLATLTQALDAKVNQVQWWMNDGGVEKYQVWLRSQLDGESKARQAQIVNIQPPDKINVYNPTERQSYFLGEYTIGIERTPYWEAPHAYPGGTVINDVNCLGGTAALPDTINGDVSARVVKLSIVPNSGISLGRYWVGWKTNRFGNAANFVPVWSIAASQIVPSTDTATASDSTAYSGTKVTTTFSTVATPTLRTVTFLTEIANAHPEDQRGSYTVLLRAKMSDTSTARVRMIYGFTAFSASPYVIPNPFYNARTPISGTSWKLYDVGVAKFPPFILSAGDLIPNIALGLISERNTGAGSLDIDCFILIPRDDGMVKLSVAGEHTTPEVAKVLQRADESLSGYTESSNWVQYGITPEPVNWGITPNSNPVVIVFAADGLTTANAKTAAADITYNYTTRWRTLRGNSA